MSGFENPILKRELKVRIRIAKLIPAIALRCVCLGLIFLLVLLSRLGSGILAFVLAEAVLILLFTPGTVCDAFVSNAGRKDLRDLALTRLRTGATVPGKLVGANLYTLIIVVLSAPGMFVISTFNRNLIYVNISLLILMFLSTAISFAFSILFHRNAIAPSIIAYALVFLMISSVVTTGPLIERVQDAGMRNAIAKSALYINPLIMVSRSLGNIDIMRTDYIYTLADPIVGRGFTYPDWRRAGVLYLGISCLFLFPAFIGFRHRKRYAVSDG